MLVILLLAASAVAQTADPAAPRPKIYGIVRESETNQPVPAAEVSVYYLGSETAKEITFNPDVLQTVRTDDGGSFVFHLEKFGQYRLTVKREGYGMPSRMQSAAAPGRFALTATSPVRDVPLYLSRYGSLVGRVMAEETGKPLPGIRIATWDAALLQLLAQGKASYMGRSGKGMGAEAVTGADGEFEIPGILPGEWVVEIGQQTSGKERVLTKFTEEDLAAVDQDFEHTYWPGGHGAQSALPVAVSSGSVVDIGRLLLRKVPYHRVLVRVPPSSCAPGDTVTVWEEFGSYQLEIWREMPCGRDVLVTGFQRGTYRLIFAVNQRVPEKREMASVPFTISDRNLTITAPVQVGLRVQARIVAADGALPPDYSKLGLSLDPIGMVRFADMAQPRQSDALGKVPLAGVPPVGHRVSVSGLNGGHYVKEIRYNGITLSDDVVPLEQPAATHELTVVLDDKPGTIAGSVKNGDKPAAQAFVMLAKWPQPAEGPPLRIVSARTTDEDGRFLFPGLAPGVYRAVALASPAELRPRTSNVLEQALAAAAKIEVGTSGFRMVSLELLALR